MHHREKIEHCHKGLENAQQTIRFVDTKTGVMFVLCTGVLRYQLKYTSSILGSSDGQWSNVVLLISIVLFMAVAVLLGSLGLSLWSLLSRPRKGAKGGSFIALFPCVKKDQWPDACVGFDKLICNLDEDQICKEYAGQLAVLGDIVNRKIAFHRWAVYCLAVAVVLTVIVCLFSPETLVQS